MALWYALNDPVLSQLERTLDHMLQDECCAPSAAKDHPGQDKQLPVSLPTKAPLAVVTAGRFDILEHDDRYELVTDAPGFSPSDISVELKEGVLTISGSHAETKETKPAATAATAAGVHKQQQQQQQAALGGTKVWRRERVVQQFSRSFKLPDNAKPDDIAAHLDKGVLSVHVPKLPPAPKPQPKRIAVQTAPAHAA